MLDFTDKNIIPEFFGYIKDNSNSNYQRQGEKKCSQEFADDVSVENLQK